MNVHRNHLNKDIKVKLLKSSHFSELKITLALAFPIVLSQLGQLSFGIMDTAMVGRIGAIPLSASAFVLNVCNIPMVFSMGICSAVSVLVAQNYGAKRLSLCGRTLNNALLFIGALSFVMVLVLSFLAPYLSLFQQPEEILSEAISFYKLTIWSILPFILYFVLKNFCEGLSRPTVPLYFLLAGLILNFCIAWVLIYGNLGFEPLGLKGAGIATLISRWFVVIGLYIYIIKSEFFKKFHVQFSNKEINSSDIKTLAKIGIPSGLQFLFETAAFAGSGIMVGWLGAKTLAAHQISLQVASSAFMVALGLAFAVGVRVGQLKGEKDYVGLKKVGAGAFAFIAVALGSAGVFIFILRHFLPTLFISDLEVIKMASQILIIVCLFQIFDSTQAVAMSALRGLQDVVVPTVIALFAYWVLALPLGYFLAFNMGYRHLGIWSALGISLFFSSVLLMSRFFYKTKKLILETHSKR